MSRRFLALRFASVSILPGLVWFFAPHAAADDKTNHPAEPLGPRAEGRRLLASLPPIKPDAMHESFFELFMHGETTGYVASSLVSLQQEKEMHYAYDDLCVIQGPTGAGTQMRTTGILDRFCTPLTLTWETTHRLPIGANATTKESLTVDATQVTFTTDDRKKPKSISVPRPAGPFVHPIGRLMTMLKPEAGRYFLLREFDAETKSFAWRSYRVTRKEDGRLRIAVGDSKGLNEEAYYILDRDGEVAQHGAAGMPFLFKRCTKERAEAIKKELAEKSKAKPAPAKRPPTTKPAN